MVPAPSLVSPLPAAADGDAPATDPAVVPPTDLPFGLPVEYAQLIANMASALRIAQTAIDDWINLTAPDHCDPQRVKRARERIHEHGQLFYQATVANAIRHALRGAPVALDPEHDAAECWRGFCSLPITVRQQLVNSYTSPTQLDAAMHRNNFPINADGAIAAKP